MNALDPRHATAVFERTAAENGKYAGRVKIHRTPNLPPGTPGSETVALHFSLRFPRIGAAVLPLTWLLAALEAHCAPVEGVELAYETTGDVTATAWVGNGWALPAGMEDFIALLMFSPRLAAIEWAVDLLPHYSHIAARAVQRPERFECIGAQIRSSLLARAEWIIPDVLCPCNTRNLEDDTYTERARSAGILQRMRDGLLRWRHGGGQ